MLENPYKSLSKRETLKAVNFFLSCLILFKFSTLTNFSILFQVMVFSFVLGENLKSHVAGGRGPFVFVATQLTIMIEVSVC